MGGLKIITGVKKKDCQFVSIHIKRNKQSTIKTLLIGNKNSL